MIPEMEKKILEQKEALRNNGLIFLITSSNIRNISESSFSRIKCLICPSNSRNALYLYLIITLKCV